MTNQKNVDISDAFRLVRTIENVSQSDFARWLHINPVSLSNIERKKHDISMETILRFYFILQKLSRTKRENDELESIQLYTINDVANKIVYPKIKDIIDPTLI